MAAMARIAELIPPPGPDTAFGPDTQGARSNSGSVALLSDGSVGAARQGFLSGVIRPAVGVVRSGYVSLEGYQPRPGLLPQRSRPPGMGNWLRSPWPANSLGCYHTLRNIDPAEVYAIPAGCQPPPMPAWALGSLRQPSGWSRSYVLASLRAPHLDQHQRPGAIGNEGLC